MLKKSSFLIYLVKQYKNFQYRGRALERITKKNFIIDVIYIALIIFLVGAASVLVLKYLMPFVIGSVIAFAVQKPSRYLSRKIKLCDGLLAAVLSVLVYLAVGAVFVFLSYRLAVFLIGLTDFLPSLFEKIGAVFEQIQQKYSALFSNLPERLNLDFNVLIEDALKKLLATLVDFISGLMSGIAKKAPSFFVSSIVTLVATCLIAKDFEHLLRFVKTLIGKQRTEKIVKIKDIIIGSVFKLGKGYFILTLITFSLLYLGFLILKIDYALSLAVIIAFVDLLPVIGTGTVLVPWSIGSVLLGNIPLGIGIGVLFVMIVIVRNFCEPKIIGMQIGINSLFTLISMFLGLKLFGVAGLILFPIIFIVVIRYYKDEMTDSLSV